VTGWKMRKRRKERENGARNTRETEGRGATGGGY